MDVDYVRVWQRQTGLSGDYNGDGHVDAADYVVWRKANGSEGIGLAADGSGNGTVDDADYLIWRQNFARMAAAAGALRRFPSLVELLSWLLLCVAPS